MARIRTIKPELFYSESLARVTLTAERTFVGLLTQADDHGRLRYNAAVLNGALWPLRPEHTVADLKQDVDDLLAENVLCQYEVDGKSYLHFPTWGDHQKISHPSTRNQSPRCPVHESVEAAPVDTPPKAPGRLERPTRKGSVPSARPARAKADTTTVAEEDSDVGIYDKPVDAFAEVLPIAEAKPKRRRATKKAAAEKAETSGDEVPTPTQVANAVAQAFYDSIGALADFQKIRTVTTKAIKAGYPADKVTEALENAHRDGRPLTADVIRQYLEGYVRRPTPGQNKAIHYAADAPRDQRNYREDL